MKRKARAIFLFLLILSLMLPICVLAESHIDVDVAVTGDNANVDVTVEGENPKIGIGTGDGSNIGVDTGDESTIGVDTGRKSQVYINGEDLNNLRPQYIIKKTKYNDKWMQEELNELYYRIDVLSNIIAKLIYKVEGLESTDDALNKKLAKLRAELYHEMNRLHYGEAFIKTHIGSKDYQVNDLFFHFDHVTAYRTNDYTTLFALRLLEKLGICFWYDEIDNKAVVTMTYADKTIVLVEGSYTMRVFDSFGNHKVTMNAAPVRHGDRVYLPTREITEHLGFEVMWDSNDDSIIIKPLKPEKPKVDLALEAYEEEAPETTDDTTPDSTEETSSTS